MARRDRITLNKILEDTKVIARLIEGYDCDTFVNDEKTQLAGLSDVAAHRYETLKMEHIWETVSINIPENAEKIKSILAD